MKFELEIDTESINKTTLDSLGVVLTQEYLEKFFKKNPQLIGYLAGQTYSFDTYEREWFISCVAEDLIGLDMPCNGDTEEVSKEFTEKWIAFISGDASEIDKEASKEHAKAWGFVE